MIVPTPAGHTARLSTTERTDIVPKDNLPATVGASEALEQMLDQLPALSVEDVIERSLARTLAATEIDDVLASPEGIGLREYVGRAVTLVGIAGVLPSRYDTGPSRYIVMDIADPDTGEKVAVTTGSPFIMARALKLAELGALPMRVRVLELESASNPGQSSLWLVNA